MVSEALTPSSGVAGTDPLVYIVVLNWNGREDTLACLRSLEQVWNERTRGIVVDNGSTDGTPDAVRTAFAAVEVLETGQNLGFTGGNNIGLRFALDRGADYVLLLNNDTVVDPRFLPEMLTVATVSEEIGFVSPKIYFLDPPICCGLPERGFPLAPGMVASLGTGNPIADSMIISARLIVPADVPCSFRVVYVGKPV